ncbi:MULTISPECIES: hypothetical protein [Enterococcus]|uniref:Uncharacterized protein n=2 Tax=Enterococcus TaxID=1350 RepID=R3UAV6_9ENTE|nr:MULTISPECIES: hypothetical protein [Enterococcus]EOL50533.1 hypothetical protein UC7_00306 [Enterococcus caccae ATCC BAA-1240]EOT59251.1 hypothetical protein I580_02283 [Enterococcus caccae ATCC BAA-1240]MBO0441095.1 hypothetical protein [Enterococcus sp. DIV0869a]MBO1353591.1 hypothetical protein [Enterococcus sp. DIV0212c]
MIDYLWIFILGGIAIVSLLVFLTTLARDVFLIKKLRKKKQGLLLNFSLLFITLTSLGLITYLFTLLREQIELLK